MRQLPPAANHLTMSGTQILHLGAFDASSRETLWDKPQQLNLLFCLVAKVKGIGNVQIEQQLKKKKTN